MRRSCVGREASSPNQVSHPPAGSVGSVGDEVSSGPALLCSASLLLDKPIFHRDLTPSAAVAVTSAVTTPIIVSMISQASGSSTSTAPHPPSWPFAEQHSSAPDSWTPTPALCWLDALIPLIMYMSGWRAGPLAIRSRTLIGATVFDCFCVNTNIFGMPPEIERAELSRQHPCGSRTWQQHLSLCCWGSTLTFEENTPLRCLAEDSYFQQQGSSKWFKQSNANDQRTIQRRIIMKS